ncbi:MAG: SusC/RagA family TonB-linked outer membrane protein [Chitinophagaceae bacterium]
MKLVTIFLFAAALTTHATGFSQKVTLDARAMPLQQLFKELSKQTGYAFLYTDEMLLPAGPVTIQLNNADLNDALTACFSNQPLSFSIIEKTVVIKPKPAVIPSEARYLLLIDIHGRIINEAGDPIEAVSVKVKGTSNGTSTNANGEFVLNNVEESATLVFSSTNIETFEVKVNGKNNFELTAKIKVGSMNEVVINKGYYTEKQKYSVSNVGRVTAQDIEKQPVSNPLLALEGRVPGLFITQTNGLPGGGVTVRIQGQNSIIKGNDPLYIIDGVPVVSQMLSTVEGGPLGSSGGAIIGGVRPGGGNPLNYINPNDIESIEILKDADATAIYGSRAANGAILITTKKGKTGKVSFDINQQNGWGQVAHKLKLLNTQQYLQMRHEALNNDGLTPDPTSDFDLTLWDTTRYTDWQKVLIGGTAKYENVSATISGGSDAVQYLVGGNYHRETTVFPGDFSDQKGSLHFNINANSLNQKFQFTISGLYMVDNNSLMYSDKTSYAIQLAPNSPALFNLDGSLNWEPTSSGDPTFLNPFGSLLYKAYQNKTNNLIGNSILRYQILPGLEIRSSFGYTSLITKEFEPNPLIAIPPIFWTSSSRNAIYSNSEVNSWNVEPQIYFNHVIGKGDINFLSGLTFNQVNSYGQQLAGYNYTSDDFLQNISAAANVYSNSTSYSKYKYNALFARANYKLLNKYIVALTARRDGSSRFGSKNQMHNFGSFGVGWIFSNEAFVTHNLGFLSFGKLRGSYGTTGNDQIGNYQFLDLYGLVSANIPYQGITGLQATALPNPYLQWEETRKLQLGVDIGLWNDKVLISANYIRNRSSNQLLPYALPIFTGYNSITTNFPASVENSSLEFAVNASPLKGGNIIWTSSINLTIPKNKILAFPNLSNSTYASAFVIGKAINTSKLYQFSTIDSTTGTYNFQSATDPFNPSYPNDATILINPNPKYYGGFQNTLKYKNIQLDFLLQFVKQIGFNYLYDLNTAVPGQFRIGLGNQTESVLERWQKPGDRANFQRFTTTDNYEDQRGYMSSSNAAYSDASYVRLKNLSLSWELPRNWKQKIHLQKGRIYFLGQNLITLTKYKGLDPESQSLSSLPPLRVYTVGLQIGL